MGRHGSRWPLQSELVYITNLTQKLAASTEYIQNADLPENLQFLKSGYVTTLGHDNLTAPGRKEMFDHGVKYVRLVPFDHVLASSYVPLPRCSSFSGFILVFGSSTSIWRLPAYLLEIKTG